MLGTLSGQEKLAVYQYDRYIKSGVLDSSPIWLDDFTTPIFRIFRQQGTIVDVGCGTGRAVPLFQQMGVNDYFGVDPSVQAIKYCKEKFPNYRFEVDELRTIGQNHPNRFGGFVLASVLMHVPRPDLVRALCSLRGSLKKDTIGFFATPSSDEGEVINRVGMRLTIYTHDEIIKGFASSGFEIEDSYTPDDWMFLGRVRAV